MLALQVAIISDSEAIQIGQQKLKFFRYTQKNRVEKKVTSTNLLRVTKPMYIMRLVTLVCMQCALIYMTADCPLPTTNRFRESRVES
jgi:hypothetical protein